MLLMKKLSLSMYLMAVAALLSVPSLAGSGDPAGLTLRLPVIITVVIVLLIVQYLFYRLLERKFRRRQEELEQIITKKNEDLIKINEKTEALLANVLPKDTAEELMAKGKATKTKYNFVTVLFSDIQGFTQIAEEMNPEVLIDELDKFFFHFDSVVDKYRIEKIKTIGDAYMCAGGIPEKNRTNPVEVTLAALEMQDYMHKLKEESLVRGIKYWDIRIGIHTGNVIAGVVGHKKLSYDIWGDTVNIASRMESSGEGGRINISGATYEFVKDFFECEYRGRMPVKYKGELEMYFVKGIRPELRDGNGLPNERFRFMVQMMKLQDVEEKVSRLFLEEAHPNLYFHNAQYAIGIAAQAELLAIAEGVQPEQYVPLKLASVFLITGFLREYENPAGASCRIMEEMLQGFGLDGIFINQARELIINSFEGRYESDSDRIMHDARYDYLGRVDFIKMSGKLLREMNEHGISTGAVQWREMQEMFLSNHDFLTNTGKLLRSVSIEEQIARLREKAY
jgi:class 3 adenylate cyclase